MPDLCSSCNNPYSIGDWPICPHGAPGPFWSGDAEIHQSEKTVIHIPPSGDLSRAHIPGRADRDMHPKLKAHGYVRHELTRTEREQFAKSRGLVSEAGNYNADGRTIAKETGSVQL